MPAANVYLKGRAYEVWQKMTKGQRSEAISKFLIENDVKSQNPDKKLPKATVEVIQEQ